MINKGFLLFLVIAQAVTAAAQTIQRLPFHYTANDSVVSIASNRYTAHSFLRNFFMGKNYRKVWNREVTVPVLRLSQAGFRIKDLGGGMQTKSLHILDSNGKEWALRSVEKYVEAAVPKPLRNTVAEDVMQDLISASLPYAAPVVGALARAAGVNAAQPRVYFVEHDTAFGKYDSLFANTLCLLEERDPGFPATEETETVINNIKNDNRYRIQQKTLLKARLLDMLIADWDRHAENWRWGMKESAGVRYYFAIPRDRDWAFYQSNGLVPKLARHFGMPHLINFKNKAKNIKDLSFKARLFDKLFLNELNADDWRTTIGELQTALTDDAIVKAVALLPKEVFAMTGMEIIDKLKSRRNSLEEYVMKYYRYQAQRVEINGSNRAEVFTITNTESGLTVAVRDSTKEGQNLYKRTFSPNETYFIVINGLGGDDVFEINENVHSSIKLEILGGKGNDRYDLKGKMRTKVYDSANENNQVIDKGKAKIHFQ